MEMELCKEQKDLIRLNMGLLDILISKQNVCDVQLKPTRNQQLENAVCPWGPTLTEETIFRIIIGIFFKLFQEHLDSFSIQPDQDVKM